jgi:hypothetical protein
MLVLAKLALGATAATVAAGGVLCSEGFINVNVNEHAGREHHHIHVIAPALIVPIAVRLVPARNLSNASEKLSPWLPTINAAIESLRNSPDGTLVEVSGPDQYVHIEKSWGSIVVDVATPDDTVHVSVPLRAISSTASALAADTDAANATSDLQSN